MVQWISSAKAPCKCSITASLGRSRFCLLQALVACKTQVSGVSSRPDLLRLRASQSSGLSCTKQPSIGVSSGVSKARATAQVGSILTPATVVASLGAAASRAIACGAGVATITWLKGPWVHSSESSKCQCFSPWIKSVIRHEKFTVRRPSIPRVMALMRGAPTQRVCSSGEGVSWPFLWLYKCGDHSAAQPWACHCWTSSTNRRSRAVKYCAPRSSEPASLRLLDMRPPLPRLLSKR